MQKRTRSTSSHLEQTLAWSINDLLYGQKGNFFLLDQCKKLQVVQMGPSCPSGVANNNTVFISSCQPMDSATQME